LSTNALAFRYREDAVGYLTTTLSDGSTYAPQVDDDGLVITSNPAEQEALSRHTECFELAELPEGYKAPEPDPDVDPDAVAPGHPATAAAPAPEERAPDKEVDQPQRGRR